MWHLPAAIADPQRREISWQRCEVRYFPLPCHPHSPTVRIREYNDGDISAIAQLYYNTVHRINGRDDTPAQIEAWAPEIYPDCFWQGRFANYHVVVAEIASIDRSELAGFAELDPDTGHIDCFYVHHAWQGCGVGKAMKAQVEAIARSYELQRLYAEVSVTAMPFFLSQGFAIAAARSKHYRGETFAQFLMEKSPITPPRSRRILGG